MRRMHIISNNYAQCRQTDYSSILYIKNALPLGSAPWQKLHILAAKSIHNSSQIPSHVIN